MERKIKGCSRSLDRSPSVTYIPSILCQLVTTMIHDSCIMYHVSCIMYYVSCIMYHVSNAILDLYYRAVRQLTRGLENLFTSIGWQLATGRWHSVKLQTKNSLFAAFFKENDSSLSPLCFHLLPIFELGRKQNFFYRANIEQVKWRNLGSVYKKT